MLLISKITLPLILLTGTNSYGELRVMILETNAIGDLYVTFPRWRLWSACNGAQILKAFGSCVACSARDPRYRQPTRIWIHRFHYDSRERFSSRDRIKLGTAWARGREMCRLSTLLFIPRLFPPHPSPQIREKEKQNKIFKNLFTETLEWGMMGAGSGGDA